MLRAIALRRTIECLLRKSLSLGESALLRQLIGKAVVTLQRKAVFWTNDLLLLLNHAAILSLRFVILLLVPQGIRQEHSANKRALTAKRTTLVCGEIGSISVAGIRPSAELFFNNRN